MDFDYEAIYGMEDTMAVGIGIFLTIYYLVCLGIGIAGYILNSLGLYTIAKRRGITNPWLAWIPLAHLWIIGSISDQFRYVTKGQIKNKRKTLVALSASLVIVAIVMLVAAVFADLAMDTAVVTAMIVWLVTLLVMFALSIPCLIVFYMAMYDLYTSVNPAYNVVFLVLTIVFSPTQPYFIFFNRKKDLGMPPRRVAPAAPVIPAPVQEPWENNPEA